MLIDICHGKMVQIIMKLLKMCNLCVLVASMRFQAHSPQAIVKPKPLARSVGNINLSTQTYQYLISAQVLPAGALKCRSFMILAIFEAFKTYIRIRKMIIDEVYHLLHFLTISLSYSLSPAFYLLLSRDLERVRGVSSQRYEVFSAAITKVSLSLRACHFSCLGQELRGQDSHSAEQSGRKY